MKSLGKRRPGYKICLCLFLWRMRMGLLRTGKVAGYAAIMLFSVLSTYLLMNYAGNKEEELVRYQEFSTPAGQRAKVLLADGTEVWLNANTILR